MHWARPPWENVSLSSLYLRACGLFHHQVFETRRKARHFPKAGAVPSMFLFASISPKWNYEAGTRIERNICLPPPSSLGQMMSSRPLTIRSWQIARARGCNTGKVCAWRLYSGCTWKSIGGVHAVCMRGDDWEITTRDTWHSRVSGLPRSTGISIHPFVQYAEVTWNFAVPVPHSEEIRRCILLFLCTLDCTDEDQWPNSLSAINTQHHEFYLNIDNNILSHFPSSRVLQLPRKKRGAQANQAQATIGLGEASRLWAVFSAGCYILTGRLLL